LAFRFNFAVAVGAEQVALFELGFKRLPTEIVPGCDGEGLELRVSLVKL